MLSQLSVLERPATLLTIENFDRQVRKIENGSLLVYAGGIPAGPRGLGGRWKGGLPKRALTGALWSVVEKTRPNARSRAWISDSIRTQML